MMWYKLPEMRSLAGVDAGGQSGIKTSLVFRLALTMLGGTRTDMGKAKQKISRHRDVANLLEDGWDGEVVPLVAIQNLNS